MKVLIPFFLAATLAPLIASAATFSFTDTAGKKHDLDQYRGKWVVVNVWATWCAPCVAELPDLQTLHQSHRDVAVLGLSVDGPQHKERVLEFSSRLGVTYPVIVGPFDSGQQFGVKGYPTTLLYDPTGKPVFRKVGKVTRAELEEAMRH